jgi:hypothetical protein
MRLARLTAQQGGGDALAGFSPPAPQAIRGRAEPLSGLSFQQIILSRKLIWRTPHDDPGCRL